MFNIINTAKAAVGEFSGSIVQCGPGFVGHTTCGKAEFFVLLHTLIRFAVYIGIVSVAVAVAFAGVLYMISQGESEQLSKAKGAITAAVTGLVIILSAWLIVNTVLGLFGCSNWNVFNPDTVSTVCSGV